MVRDSPCCYKGSVWNIDISRGDDGGRVLEVGFATEVEWNRSLILKAVREMNGACQAGGKRPLWYGKGIPMRVNRTGGCSGCRSASPKEDKSGTSDLLNAD